MVSAIVLDENNEEREYTLRILESTGIFDNLTGFSSPEVAYTTIIEEKYNILFLETEMNNKSCFLLIDRIQQARQDFFYVIMTGNRNYAFEALKKGAADYLIKPLTHEGVVKTMNKIKRYL